MRSNRLPDARLLRLVLAILAALGVALAGSQAGPLQLPAVPEVPLRVSLPETPPRHWTAPPETIDPSDFVRRADERDLSWIRGHGY